MLADLKKMRTFAPLSSESTSENRSFGEVAEWSIAAVLKTVVLRGTRGSNPCLSAISIENQYFIELTPNFTSKNVKLGVLFYLRKPPNNVESLGCFYHFQLFYEIINVLIHPAVLFRCSVFIHVAVANPVQINDCNIIQLLF